VLRSDLLSTHFVRHHHDQEYVVIIPPVARWLAQILLATQSSNKVGTTAGLYGTSGKIGLAVDGQYDYYYGWFVVFNRHVQNGWSLCPIW
jgi:hypothetical protein